MLKKYIRHFCIALSVVLLLCVIPISAAENNQPKSDSKETNYTLIDSQINEYIEICRNDIYTLTLNPSNHIFAVCDSATNQPLWYSGMSEANFGSMEEVSPIWQAYMQSVAVVNYVAKDATRANNMKSYSADRLNSSKLYKGENGIRYEFDFKALDVSLAVEIALEGDRIVARVPAEDIKEEGDFAIKSVNILPFFSAVSKADNADGYIVYPDGNGAISYFDKAQYKHAYTQSIALDIYDSLDLETTLEEDKNATAMLPIYGIKNNNLGVMAAITKGSESARINVSTAVSNAEMPIHHADFEMVYRNEYKIFLSNITGEVSGSETVGVKVDEELLPIDREITYFLLRDGNANYSGMANVYREYLISTKQLAQSKLADKTGLYLNMFMGTTKEGAIVNPFVEMTDFEYVEDMSKNLLENGVENLQVRLRGWAKGGYSIAAKSYKPATELGGKKGLDSLSELAESDDRLGIQLELNYVESAKNRYVSVKESTMPITNEEESRFLTSPLRTKNMLEKAINSLDRYKNIDIAFASAGERLYPDYSKSRKATRSDTMDMWRKIGETEKVSSVQGGNLYMLSCVEQLYDIPMTCSMQQMTDEAIPWYSMIVSGSIPFTTTYGNLSGDLDLLKLQWIEYGAMPGFELTKESPTNLLETEYNKLFSSQVSKWGTKALEIYKDMSTRLEAVVGWAMVSHERVMEELVVITYENGCRVIINYGDTEAEISGQKVGAKDYAVCVA